MKGYSDNGNIYTTIIIFCKRRKWRTERGRSKCIKHGRTCYSYRNDSGYSTNSTCVQLYWMVWKRRKISARRKRFKSIYTAIR